MAILHYHLQMKRVYVKIVPKNGYDIEDNTIPW